jgi:phosphoribosyl 1,2-cyclic phosphate phosphodiesterase
VRRPRDEPAQLAYLTVTLLGSGTSTGIPVIGCDCAVCTSEDPRDRRLRVSAYVVAETVDGPVHVVIDTGPDFRQQALTHRIREVDAVLYTHHHFDHVAGMDDLRPYLHRVRAPIPCYASAETAGVLRRSFAYIFEDGSYPGVARLALNEVDGAFPVGSRAGTGASIEVVPVPALHGGMTVLGFRIGGYAHLTDVSAIPDSSMGLLEDLDVLVLDGLRHRPHPTHLTVSDAVTLAGRIGAQQTYLVHMTHDLGHAETEAMLPFDVRLGYDGLVVEVGG